MEARLTTPTRSALVDSSYAAHFDDLVRLCRALGGGPDSEDIAQETLMYARAHATALRDETKVTAWLRAIAVRKTSHSRSRRVQSLTLEQVSAPVQTDLGMDLASAIARLPIRERTVLTLVHGLGYSQREVAEALSIRRGTVAATLFHARQKLADWLIDYQRSR